jgi:hypothetical protein
MSRKNRPTNNFRTRPASNHELNQMFEVRLKKKQKTHACLLPTKYEWPDSFGLLMDLFFTRVRQAFVCSSIFHSVDIIKIFFFV